MIQFLKSVSEFKHKVFGKCVLGKCKYKQIDVSVLILDRVESWVEKNILTGQELNYLGLYSIMNK